MLMYNMHNAETSEREIMAKSWKITTMPLQWINDKSTKHACAGLLGYAFHFEGLPSKISNEKSCTHSKCRINFTKLGTCVHCYFRWWCQQLSDNQNIRTAKISKQHTWFWLHFTYGTFRMMCAVQCILVTAHTPNRNLCIVCIEGFRGMKLHWQFGGAYETFINFARISRWNKYIQRYRNIIHT